MALKTKAEEAKLFSQWLAEKVKNYREDRRKKGYDQKKTYGILCAMEEEVKPIVKAMFWVRSKQVSTMTFYTGRLHGKKAVVVKCGVGKVNAAVCAQTLCSYFQVDALIHVGVAGSPYPGIEQKDIVISTQTVQHDFDLTPLGYAQGENSDLDCVYFPASLELVRLAHIAADAVIPDDVHVYEGTIASGDQFIADAEKSKKIFSLFSAMAVEMEGAAVGQVAHLYKVPYVIIRSISDNADHSANLSFYEYVEVASAISADVVCKMMDLA